MRWLIAAAARMTRDANRATSASSASAEGNVRATPASGWPSWPSTAAAILGLKAWVTNEYEHDGLRVSGGKVLDRLIAMNRGEV